MNMVWGCVLVHASLGNRLCVPLESCGTGVMVAVV